MHEETFLFVLMAAMALVAVASVAWLASRLLHLFGGCGGASKDEGKS